MKTKVIKVLLAFSETADIAISGPTNAGKTTFISSLIDLTKCEEWKDGIKKLIKNDGGLTKVTTYYKLGAFERISIEDITFNEKIFTLGGQTVQLINNKIKEANNCGLKIELIPEEDYSIEELNILIKERLENEKSRLKDNIQEIFDIINNKKIIKFIRNIKLCIPTKKQVLKLLVVYGFKYIVLRDTRGFLDIDIKEDIKQIPTIEEMSLEGINACILMNGQNTVIPNFGREFYGEFVKSIFESVPTIIVERSAVLGDRLETVLESGNELTEEYIKEQMENSKVKKRNFKEINKWLNELGIIDKNNECVNNLIGNHKIELIIPEVSDIEEDTCKSIYERCSLILLEEVLSKLSKFRDNLQRIVHFFDEEKNILFIENTFDRIFNKIWLGEIIREYNCYGSHNQIVRPVLAEYFKKDILDGLVKDRLLGPRGGITTRDSSNIYRYGATGVCAVTSLKLIDKIIKNLSNDKDFLEELKNTIEDTSDNDNLIKLYVYEIQEFLKYALLISTDEKANFSSYSIIDRYFVVNAVKSMKKEWEKYSLSKNMSVEVAMDRLYYSYIKDLIIGKDTGKSIIWESETMDYVRFSQLKKIFENIFSNFFNEISNKHKEISIRHKSDLQIVD